ncbi:protein PFC0760c [Nilaparvata lugens]|uniref:protein PFC0760c n=1 Tax=Nilaparvata lugens TaxID=108931 RepID=UPI00193E5547|nr:protein PFC0760c [Nilaparvata lugens]
MINRDYSGDRSNCETVDESPIIEKVILNDVYDHDTLTSFDELDTDNRTNNLVANSDQSGVSYELNNENMEYKNYNDDQSSRKDLTDYGKNHRSYIDNQNMQRSQSSKDIPSNGREFEDIANHMLNKLNVKYLESGKNHSNVRKNHKFSINKDSSMNHRYFKHDFNDQENESVNKNDGNSENGLSQEEERYKDKSDENYGNDLDSQGGKFHKKNHGNFENDITHQVNGLDSNSNRIFENNFNPKGSEYDEKFNVKFGNKQKNEYKSNVQIENYLKQQKSVSDRRNHYQEHENDSADQEENVDTKNHDNFGNIINQQGNGNGYDNQEDGITKDDRRVKNDDAERNSKFYSYLKNRGGSDPHDEKQELNSKNGDKNHIGSERSNEKHDSSSGNDDKYNFGTVMDDEEDASNSKNGVGSFDRHKILMDAIRNRFRGTTGSYFPEKTEKTPSGSEEDVEFSPRKSSRPICHDVTPEAHCIKEEDKYFCKIGKSSYTIYTGPNPSVSSKVIEDYVRSMFQKYGEGDRCLDMSFGAGKHGPCLKNKMPVDNQMSLSSHKTAISSKLYPGRKRGTLNIICTPLAPPPKGVDCRDTDGTSREMYYECRWRTPNKIVEC